MDWFGSTINEGIERSTSTIKEDLSNLLKCTVEVSFFDHLAVSEKSDFSDFKILESSIEISNLNCQNYTETTELLDFSGKNGEIKWGSHLLRSNCKITNQPDWGSVFIQMKGDKLPTGESFLKYIVSLRNENHFHEEICEMIFQRMHKIYSPEKLMVCCLYTRRGGIDINPVRSTDKYDIPANLNNCKQKDCTQFRQ